MDVGGVELRIKDLARYLFLYPGFGRRDPPNLPADPRRCPYPIRFFRTREAESEPVYPRPISVSGVGASTARMMLSSMRSEEIIRAITQGNTRQLESIKGIGKKFAERIILELRDKFGRSKGESNISTLINNTLEQDALNALITLGIARSAAEQAIKKIMNEPSGSDKVEDVIKKALKIL